MVIIVLGEKCLACSERLSGTMEFEAEPSRTSGGFDKQHVIETRAFGADRVLRGINASGTCGACGAPFSYRLIIVMQMKARAGTD